LKRAVTRIATVFFLVALVAGGYAAYTTINNRADSRSTALTTPVRKGPLAVSIPTIGVLQAKTSIVLSSPFEGRVIRLVPEGARVAAGDPVIWFETREYEDQLDEQLAQLALDERDLQSAYDALELEKLKNQYTMESEKTRVEIARRDFEDSKQKFESEQVLFTRNISPQTQLEGARLKLLQSELGLRNAQINLAKVEENLVSNIRLKEREIDKARLRMEETQRQVTEAQERIESAIVRAPSPGEVSYMRRWTGGTLGKVTEGDQVSRRTSLVELPDTSIMLAVVPINEIDISRIEVGQRAEIMLEAIPGSVFPGKVESKSIVPITDAARRMWDSSNSTNAPREYEVQIRLEQNDALFRQGMTAGVRIYINEIPETLYVPIEAIVTHDGERGVWASEGLTKRFVPVTVITSNENFAAIDGDVQEGMALILDARSQPVIPTGPESPVAAEQIPTAELPAARPAGGRPS
jgi:HlyD family secretion protein